MTIEINRPELEQRMLAQIQSGQFHDVDELLTKALDALEGKGGESPAGPPQRELRRLPVWRLGSTGSFHRRDLYSDGR